MSDCEVKCRNNGPLLLSGSFTLKDSDEAHFDLGGRETIALCRCGHSENKPFCDGEHSRKNFISEIKVPSMEK